MQLLNTCICMSLCHHIVKNDNPGGHVAVHSETEILRRLLRGYNKHEPPRRGTLLKCTSRIAPVPNMTYNVFGGTLNLALFCSRIAHKFRPLDHCEPKTYRSLLLSLTSSNAKKIYQVLSTENLTVNL